METRASVRELAAAGKQIDKPDAELKRIAVPDPAIEAWLVSLDIDTGQLGHCRALLSRDEQQRADRFHFKDDRRRFIVARGMLRVLLGSYLDTAPAAITFGYAKNGKPLVAGHAAQIHFNVSHSGERALYAVSRSCALGVDIEQLNRDVDHDALSRRFFGPGERAALLRLPESRRKRAFFACWTRKEALIKATGDGLSLPLDQFEVTVEPDAKPRLLVAAPATQRISDWHLYTADVGSDYVATVAALRIRKQAKPGRTK